MHKVESDLGDPCIPMHCAVYDCFISFTSLFVQGGWGGPVIVNSLMMDNDEQQFLKIITVWPITHDMIGVSAPLTQLIVGSQQEIQFGGNIASLLPHK